ESGRRGVAVTFFFQAEDGIRDRNVTGVQTCALPIFPPAQAHSQFRPPRRPKPAMSGADRAAHGPRQTPQNRPAGTQRQAGSSSRSEEHTSELQSRFDLVCRLLLEKKNKQ